MKLLKISIENYRGIKNKQDILVSNLSSIVGKNDAGKSIILNAIASFLDIKSFPITKADFNDVSQPITVVCNFEIENIDIKLLEDIIIKKIAKEDGLEEFLSDLIIDDNEKKQISLKKQVHFSDKMKWFELIYSNDYEDESFTKLYNKKDTELQKIIADNSIFIPISGEGRNSKLEKIKYIKEYCNACSQPRSFNFINDDYKISTILPAVEFFKADFGLELDTNFKNTSVTEISDYFKKEISQGENSKLTKIQQEIESELDNEAMKIKDYMKDYVSSLDSLSIKPEISWSSAIKNINVELKFDGDEKFIPISHKGTGYRRLFMVARFRYLAEKNKENNVIYLIEEPETYLHPSAQKELLDAFRELSNNNQIIITTHSTIFAGATNIESMILCYKEQQQSVYRRVTDYDQQDDMLNNIIDELGVKPWHNLMDYHTKIVFVESHNDAAFYNIICKKLVDSELINDREILVLPCAGDNIDHLINIKYFTNSNRTQYLIIDSDNHDDKKHRIQQSRITAFEDKSSLCKAYMLKASSIESYYHPRAIEQCYELDHGTFENIPQDVDPVTFLKDIIENKQLQTKGIGLKNNFKIFNHMTTEQWQELVENELIDFLKDITHK